MVATSPQLTRAGFPPALAARIVLWGWVAVNLIVVNSLFLTAGAGKNSLLTAAKFFGLHAAMVMMLQLVLVARIPWLDRRLGMDRLTAWHRWVGFTLLWTVLTHASLILIGYATLDGVSVFKTFGAMAGITASLLGMLAVAIIIVTALVSMRYARRRLSYETWHALHIAVYAAITLALIHQALEGTTFTSSTFAKVYWWTTWTLILTALVLGRFVLPLWRNAYHQFRVSKVVPESDNVVSVYITGRNLDKLPARPGQFFIWHFLGHNRWWQANPFSMSAAPNGESLRLTAKAVGGTSAGLRQLPVGTRVFAEGPYGAFTDLHRGSEKVLLIAGGVGITPIRSLLEGSTGGSVVVLYRVRTDADAVLLPELRELAAHRDAQVHVLSGRTSPTNAPFEPANLKALVPDIHERDIYVCGPAAMTSAVLHATRALKVPSRQVHAERFSLA